MQIGEVIRKYRKDKNMTQEEMANRLGVTAPAVNKWENGNSMPDIMLLAPIARLLDITLDELLSFRETLTDDEIKVMIREADEKFKTESFDEVFQWAKKTMEQYPNCEHLILWMAVMLDAGRITREVSDPEKYDDYLCDCYTRVLNSTDETTKTTAADALFSFYMRKEQYEKAEEYLNYYSLQNPDRKRKQAEIYSKTGRIQEAYKEYEEILFRGYTMLSMVFHHLYMLELEDHNMEKAHYYADKQADLARLFEYGEYYEVSCKLELAVLEKDTDAAIEIMKKMLNNMEDSILFYKSTLYSHLTFSELNKDFLDNLRNSLLENFRSGEDYDFLREDERFLELIK